MLKILCIVIFFLTCLISFGQSNSNTIKEDEFIDPDVMAEFPGGMKALNKFILDSITSKVSISKEELNILRTAYSKFIVTEKGKVVGVKIIRSSNIPRIDSLVVEALRKMPDWKPSLINGKVQNWNYNLPIRFEFK